MLLFFILSAIGLAVVGFFCGAWAMLKVTGGSQEVGYHKGYFAGYLDGVATKLPSEEVA